MDNASIKVFSLIIFVPFREALGVILVQLVLRVQEASLGHLGL